MYTSMTNTSAPLTKKLEIPMTVTTDELKEIINNLKTRALQSLQIKYKNGAIEFLILLREGSITMIDQDILDKDIPIANLILQQEIPEALEPFLQSIRPENRLLVISGGTYAYHALREFVRRSLQMNDAEYQTCSETKRKILEQLIKINPEVIIKIISAEINQRVDLPHPFKNDFEAFSKVLQVSSPKGGQNPLTFIKYQNKENIALSTNVSP